MKIIQLGHYNVRFICTKCKTIFECSTDEIFKNKNNEYEIKCPICDTSVTLNNDSDIIKLLKWRDRNEEL